jgi:hypothetical protein
MVVRLQGDWLIYAVDNNILLNIVHCLVYINITLYYIFIVLRYITLCYVILYYLLTIYDYPIGRAV